MRIIKSWEFQTYFLPVFQMKIAYSSSDSWSWRTEMLTSRNEDGWDLRSWDFHQTSVFLNRTKTPAVSTNPAHFVVFRYIRVVFSTDNQKITKHAQFWRFTIHLSSCNLIRIIKFDSFANQSNQKFLSSTEKSNCQ